MSIELSQRVKQLEQQVAELAKQVAEMDRPAPAFPVHLAQTEPVKRKPGRPRKHE